MRKKAMSYLAILRANVQAWYDGAIEYETFRARQRKAWETIRAEGLAVSEIVLRAIRDELPPLPNARRVSDRTKSD